MYGVKTPLLKNDLSTLKDRRDVCRDPLRKEIERIIHQDHDQWKTYGSGDNISKVPGTKTKMDHTVVRLLSRSRIADKRHHEAGLQNDTDQPEAEINLKLLISEWQRVSCNNGLSPEIKPLNETVDPSWIQINPESEYGARWNITQLRQYKIQEQQ